MDNLKFLINLNQSKFNADDKKLLSCFEKRPQQCKNKSLEELSKITFVSKTEILNFCKKIGLNSYSEFKSKYIISIRENSSSLNESKNFDKKFILAIQEIQQELSNSNLKQLYSQLKNSKEIYIFTTGWKEEIIANYLSHQLFIVGKTCIILPFNYYEIKLVNSHNNFNKSFLIISYIKENKEIRQKLSNLELIHSKNKIILLVNQKNKVFKNVEWQLYYPAINFQVEDNFYNKPQAFTPAFYLVDQLVSRLNSFLVSQKNKN